MRGAVVGGYMSRGPYTVGRLEPLALAHRQMRAHGVRHLPVLDGSRLVGMVSLRDLHLIETLRDVDPETVTVEEAMTADPFTVRPDTPLREVIEGMVGHRYGSAVVLEGDAVVGVFTTRDALRALVELLGERRRAPRKAANRGAAPARKPASRAAAPARKPAAGARKKRAAGRAR